MTHPFRIVFTFRAKKYVIVVIIIKKQKIKKL